jgi:Na+-transporting methylmalonyl-CoA/oxaloacetate decarboxylase gamma subunit
MDMEYLPEAISIMGIGITVVFLTLSFLVVALWALAHFTPTPTVSAGEEVGSLNQDNIMKPQKSSPPKENVRAAIIAVALARLLRYSAILPIPSPSQKRTRLWWEQGLTNQFIDRTNPQEIGNSWKIGGDWRNRNYTTTQSVQRLTFSATTEPSPTRIHAPNVSNKEAAAAAAVAIAHTIEKPKLSEQ